MASVFSSVCPAFSALRGGLNRPVRHRVGEEHAQLDNVGACRWQAGQNGKGGFRVWVAGGNKSDKGFATFFSKRQISGQGGFGEQTCGL